MNKVIDLKSAELLFWPLHDPGKKKNNRLNMFISFLLENVYLYRTFQEETSQSASQEIKNKATEQSSNRH